MYKNSKIKHVAYTSKQMFENDSVDKSQIYILDSDDNLKPQILNFTPSDADQDMQEITINSEIDLQSPWIDISCLQQGTQKSILPSTSLASNGVAVSTIVPSYIDLPTTYQIQQAQYSNYMMPNDFSNAKEPVESKTLKSITAEAGICKCSDCKCGPNGSCKSTVVKKEPDQVEIDTNKLIEEIDSLNVDTLKHQNSSSCECKTQREAINKNCCVVICLKTLETMKAENKSLDDLMEQKPMCAKN